MTGSTKHRYSDEEIKALSEDEIYSLYRKLTEQLANADEELEEINRGISIFKKRERECKVLKQETRSFIKKLNNAYDSKHSNSKSKNRSRRSRRGDTTPRITRTSRKKLVKERMLAIEKYLSEQGEEWSTLEDISNNIVVEGTTRHLVDYALKKMRTNNLVESRQASGRQNEWKLVQDEQPSASEPPIYIPEHMANDPTSPIRGE
jgi:hypothetical protein